MTEHTSADDHGFVWWLCMLPFLAAMGVFLYRWLHNRTEMELLGYAVGALLIGVVFSAWISGSTKGAEEAASESSKEGNGAP